MELCSSASHVRCEAGAARWQPHGSGQLPSRKRKPETKLHGVLAQPMSTGGVHGTLSHLCPWGYDVLLGKAGGTAGGFWESFGYF